jgi:probable HAF family extracellular repeat protein
MKSTVLTRITGTALFAVLAISALVRGQEEQEHKREHFPRYRVKDLGTLKGGTFSQGLGMNNRGHVGGAAAVSNGNLHAFLWTKHTGMQDLETLGGPNSEAGPVNESDEVAIISETPYKDPNGEDFCGFGTHLQCLGAIWENGVLTALSTLGGPNGQAYDLNNQGQVVGFAENDKKEKIGYCATPFQRFDFEAVIWEPDGEIRELPPLREKGDTVGFAFGINDKGQAVGTSGKCSDTAIPPAVPNGPRAVLWESDRSPKDLGNLGGTMTNIASSINNRGEVVGGSQLADGNIHPFLWTKENGMQDLGTFPGAVATVVPCCNTINDRREVVGFSIDASGSFRAFVWKDNVYMNLNRLIPKNSPWNLQAAESINDVGEITGYGTIHGETHAFLAIPCHRHGDRECCEDHDR